MAEPLIRPEEHLRLVTWRTDYWARRDLPPELDRDELWGLCAVALVRAARTFDPTRAQWSTYAAHCMDREVLNALRQYWRHRGREVSLDGPAWEGDDGDTITLGAVLPAPGPGPEQAFEDRDEAERLRLAIETLPARQRVIVRLRYWREVPWRGVAERVGCCRATAINEERRAIGRLRRAMEPGGTRSGGQEAREAVSQSGARGEVVGS